MSESEHAEHDPGEPDPGEGHDPAAPHDAGGPTSRDDEPTDADEAAEWAEGHA